MQFVVGHSVLASFRLIRLHGEKIRKVEMLIGLHLKCCSIVICTISGERDVVKTITSRDKPTITVTIILLAKGVGTRLNDAQSKGRPSPNKTNMTNKTQPSNLFKNDARRIIGLLLLKDSKNRAWWLTSNGLKQIEM